MFVINQMREKTSDFIFTTIPNQYAKANRFSKACMIISGASAVEMAISTVGNIYSILNNGGTEALRYNFSANLGGTIYYGISAFNPISGSASIAGTIFSIYSCIQVNSPNKANQTYLTSEIIGRSFNFIGKVLEDFRSEFLSPVATKISTIAEPIFTFIYDSTVYIATQVVELFGHISLPKHPIWLGVGSLLTMLFIFKVVYPSIKACLNKDGEKGAEI